MIRSPYAALCGTEASIMKRFASTLIVLAVLVPGYATAQQEESYDYWRTQRDMVRYGQQAIFMCNGLFTSNRTIDQVFEQELAYLTQPVGTPDGGDYEIDRVRRAVAIGAPGGTPVMRAAFREGLGCIILAPDQTFEDIESLPRLDTPPIEGDPDKIPWPDGDMIKDQPLLPNVNAAILEDASNWAFKRISPEQVTLSLIVVHKGQIIHERYAPGFDVSTRTRTWSTAKSLAVTLIGMLADQGELALDEPLGLDWFPRAQSPETDPRNAITLRNVLNMSSGLYTVDNRGLEYATGSGMSYWAGASSVRGALSRALFRQPGTMWDYENYDTLLGVYAMKLAL
ncbi:MAG TPA: class A beta-lactamase-related serine hydrolase, partial [Gemmatimonadetes bacterium]|nr:class A beta-lactamase-related serine hydrolase [Gemmatimonadota bacterium]